MLYFFFSAAFGLLMSWLKKCTISDIFFFYFSVLTWHLKNHFFPICWNPTSAHTCCHFFHKIFIDYSYYNQFSIRSHFNNWIPWKWVFWLMCLLIRIGFSCFFVLQYFCMLDIICRRIETGVNSVYYENEHTPSFVMFLVCVWWWNWCWGDSNQEFGLL